MISPRLKTCLFLTPLLILLPVLCFAWQGKAVHVTDGDTITVLHDGEREKIRLYGIDTPESSQWYGQNAKQFLSSQVFDKTVEITPMDTDRYGRTVGIVSMGDLVVNRTLVEYGYAWVYDQYCKESFCEEWRRLEELAREEKRGLWAKPKPIPPWDYRRGTRSEATENYCQHAESWKEWDRLVAKYPNDMEIHYLHALRLGLCAKVERGDLTVQEATEIFEQARGAVVERRKAAGTPGRDLEL